MGSTFSLDETFILSVWVETLLYGCLALLFCGSMYVLLLKGRAEPVSKPMLFTAVSMFVLATAHIAINLRRLLEGYVWQDNAVAYFSDLANPTHVAKDTIYTTQSILGDAFAIYRCYLLWNRKLRVIVLPLLLLLCSTISGYIVAWRFTRSPTDVNVFAQNLNSWILAFYSMALLQNILTTSFIAYAIWKRERNLAAFRLESRSSLLPIAAIVVESAAVYVAAQLVLLVLYAIQHNAQYIALETITPTIGIVFMSIIVRVGLHCQLVKREMLPSSRSKRDSDCFRLQPMSIRVSTQQVTHVDESSPTSANTDDPSRNRVCQIEPHPFGRRESTEARVLFANPP